VSTCEVRVRHQDGRWRNIEVTATNHLDNAAVGGMVWNCRDVTERVAAARVLAYEATHDSLTGLANRALILDRLDHALARAERSGRPCALLFVDLDRFKPVNDRFGHAAGDEVLVTVAGRLRDVVRPGDTVGRLGGDEFVVLAEDIDRAETAVELAERVRNAITEPVPVGGHDVHVGTSIGIVLADDRHRPESLLQEADAALFAAKAQGRNRCVVYQRP
jgi:diguanylate cyclase (GGDEF)-like protein